MRPKQPKFTDHNDPDSYYNLNRYYNEAEKAFDKLERLCRKVNRENWGDPDPWTDLGQELHHLILPDWDGIS